MGREKRGFLVKHGFDYDKFMKKNRVYSSRRTSPDLE